MRAFRLNVVGWSFQVLGTLFLLLDSIRVSIRLPREGVRLGDPPQIDSWIYHWASSIGFGCLLIGFAVCGVALWLCRPKSSSGTDTASEAQPGQKEAKSRTPSQTGTPPQVVQAYFEGQYRRLGQLEEHGLHASAFVITLAVGVFTFGYRLETPEFVRNNVLPWVILATNLIVAVYVWRVLCGQTIHSRRAKATLELHASELFDVESRIDLRFWPQVRLRPWLQIFIHLILAGFAFYLWIRPPVLHSDLNAKREGIKAMSAIIDTVV